jgi:hypothetical protein
MTYSRVVSQYRKAEVALSGAEVSGGGSVWRLNIGSGDDVARRLTKFPPALLVASRSTVWFAEVLQARTSLC